MSLISVKCPACGVRIELNKNREVGFCSYCGVKIQINETATVKISADGLATAESLLKKGILEFKSGRTSESYKTFNEAMKIAPDNPRVLLCKFYSEIDYLSIYCNYKNVSVYFKEFFKRYSGICDIDRELIKFSNKDILFLIFCSFGDRERLDYITNLYKDTFFEIPKVNYEEFYSDTYSISPIAFFIRKRNIKSAFRYSANRANLTNDKHFAPKYMPIKLLYYYLENGVNLTDEITFSFYDLDFCAYKNRKTSVSNMFENKFSQMTKGERKSYKKVMKEFGYRKKGCLRLV